MACWPDGANVKDRDSFLNRGGLETFFSPRGKIKRALLTSCTRPQTMGKSRDNANGGKGDFFYFPGITQCRQLPGELTFVHRHVSFLTYRNLRKSPAAAPLARIYKKS